MVLVIGGVVNLFSGCGADEEGEEPAKQETKAAEETTRERASERANREEKEEAERVSRLTPEEKLRENVEGELRYREKNLRQVLVWDEGCTKARVDYLASTPTGIEFEMERIYQAIYGDGQHGSSVCFVEINAFESSTDSYGQPTPEKLGYSTSMAGETAARVNWSEPFKVDFPSIWTVNYVNPTTKQAIEQAEAQAEFDRVVDCMVDEGFFDNWLCP